MNTKDAQHDLPERYTPLVEYGSSKLRNRTVQFEAALRRTESRRLLAQDKLRIVLLSYWSKPFEELKALRPFDILYSFQEYAESTLNAAGEECAKIFEDAEAYTSFLDVAQECVLDGIFPKPQTVKQTLVRHRNALEEMHKSGALEALIQETCADREMVRQFDAATNKTKESIIELPDKLTSDNLYKLIQQEQMIGLRETFAAFGERTLGKFGFSTFCWGGDWEEILGDSLYDARRMESHSLGAHGIASALSLALQNKANRKAAKEFLAVGLDQLYGPLMAAWWNASADVCLRAAICEGPEGSIEGPPGKRAARRHPRYKNIDYALREIAESRPRKQEEVFQSLDKRRVPVPPAEPFITAGGWMAGFRRDQAGARAWLSKRWRELDLTPLPKGPKKK
jgi:hypothetical protein